jgi:CBS domain containing-hemolysin-like protein
VSDVAALAVALVLLAGNAFFVGAEFALISARRTQVEPRALAGSRAARTTLRAMENVSLMMAGAQLGITMCSLGLGAVGEPAVAHLLEPVFEAAGVPEALLSPIAFAIALAVVVSLHMVLGEMVPKNIAIAGPERAAIALGPVLYATVTVLKPVIWALNWVSNHVLKLLKVTPQDEVASAFTADEVSAFVAESRREGLLDDEEHDLLAGALSFDERQVGSVVMPLDDLVTVGTETTVDEVEALCARTGYSRFPVVDGGAVTAYVHLKDLLGTPNAERGDPVPPDRRRPLVSVETGQTLRSALSAMQSQGAHLARAVDPGEGGLAGLVALEDLVEELVGEVADGAQRAAQDGESS